MTTMWLRYGEELSWLQRFVYALISLFLFPFGLIAASMVAAAIRAEEYLSAAIWLLLMAFLLGTSVGGLLNVLRFPKK